MGGTSSVSLRWVLLTCVAAAGCSADRDSSSSPPSDDAGVLVPPSDGGSFVDFPSPFDLGADCDPSRSVASDGPAVLVREPEILSAFSLRRVLTQLVASAGADSSITPDQLLQRLFDTLSPRANGVFEDNVHCDDAGNDAFRNAAPVACPRAEAALATSTAFFVDGDPDSFVPLALVNRFDLMPSNLLTCGEYRLIYGKLSGRADAQNRVLLIFEGVLPNPTHTLAGCRPVAELWSGLESEPELAVRRTQLERFFFDGVSGFAPLVQVAHFGEQTTACEYGACGQIRAGLGMQAPWEFREFRLRQALAGQPGPALRLVPTTVKNALVPSLFDAWATDDWTLGFRWQMQDATQDLGGAERVSDLHVQIADAYNAGQSAFEGPASPDYASRALAGDSPSPLVGAVSETIASLELACADGGALTTENVFQRLAALSCAGCHAPDRVLLSGRELGCGLVWPSTPGPAHIDEQGALSPALADVFLPHRASVLATYLRACDKDAILKNLQPAGAPTCFVAGTPIAMADGSQRPIERVIAGELVLAFDERTSDIVSAEVVRTFVHPNSDGLVVVNSTLVTTANHPFYSDGAWIRAEALDVGGRLLTLASILSGRSGVTTTAVQQLSMSGGVATTYNIEVAVHHNYFAGGVLVHNKSLK